MDKNKPRRIDKYNWYYLCPTYIEIIHQQRDYKGVLVCAQIIKIKHRRLIADLKLLGKVKEG